jgi:hypothetical protein
MLMVGVELGLDEAGAPFLSQAVTVPSDGDELAVVQEAVEESTTP